MQYSIYDLNIIDESTSNKKKRKYAVKSWINNLIIKFLYYK
jgi:hypothetical protein